jgi:predicted nucleic acid-binding protein
MLELMLNQFKNVVIPKAVYNETVTEGKKLKKLDAFLIEKKVNKKRIKIKKVNNDQEKEILMENFNLHEGEAEAIRIYKENEEDLLGTDDWRAIEVCKILDINYFTTLSFTIWCKTKNLISREKILYKLNKLQEIGWYKEDLIKDFKQTIKNKRGLKNNG